MTRTQHDEVEQLEREIGERESRLEQLKAPMTPDEAAKLAKEDPDEFNARWEAGRRAGHNPIQKEDDR